MPFHGLDSGPAPEPSRHRVWGEPAADRDREDGGNLDTLAGSPDPGNLPDRSGWPIFFNQDLKSEQKAVSLTRPLPHTTSTTGKGKAF